MLIHEIKLINLINSWFDMVVIHPLNMNEYRDLLFLISFVSQFKLEILNSKFLYYPLTRS